MTMSGSRSTESSPPGQRRERRDRVERVLFRRVADGDTQAREELVTRYMPLARSLARRYRHAGEPLEDVLQVASLGLIKAVDRFNADREIAFSSFAVPTVLGEIKRYFRDRTWAVRVPRGLQELSQRVDRAVSELSDELCRQPSVSEIAVSINVPQEDVLEAMQASSAYRSVSLDAPRAVGRSGSVSTLGASFGVDESGFDRAEDRATLAALVKRLTSREREVLRMRFEADMTQAEIGAVIGVSQMQVSRIIRQALQRLHAHATAHGVLDDQVVSAVR